jgi:hypothetical protein
VLRRTLNGSARSRPIHPGDTSAVNDRPGDGTRVVVLIGTADGQLVRDCGSVEPVVASPDARPRAPGTFWRGLIHVSIAA